MGRYRSNLRRAYHSTALAIFALLLGIYLLSSGGHFYAIDEEMMFSVTESLAQHGSFAINAGEAGVPRYSQYGPAQSIAALPLFELARALGTVFPGISWVWLSRAIVGWFNPLVTAAVAALLYRAARLLGLRRTAALGTAMLYGLGTMAWPHSKTFFAEPLSALVLLAASVLPLVAARRKGTERANVLPLMLCAGLLAGIAPAIKVQSVIALPFLGLYALACAPQAWRARLAAGASWGAGAAVPLALLALYQQALFGNPLATGYGGGVWQQFSTPFWVGFAGQIWSSGRGILWYAPPVLLFPAGIWMLWRRDRALALLCLFLPIAHVLFYAKWVDWDGAGAWGPRFLNAVLPFLMLPLAPLLDSMRGRATPVRVAAVAMVALLAVPVQFGGVSINLDAFLSATRNTNRSNYRLADSAITGHLALALDQLNEWYALHFTPASVVLVNGFSHSEGPGSQLPRWTLARAAIEVRPPAAETILLRLGLHSCWTQPTPARVDIRLNDVLLVGEVPCPQRVYQLMLPSGSSNLTIDAPGWRPNEFGSDRDETLGVYLQSLTAEANGQALTLLGQSLPVPPMPGGQFAQRRWAGDHRTTQWDYWWWYLRFDQAPRSTHLWLGALWLGLAVGALGWGLCALISRRSGVSESVRAASSANAAER